MSQSGMAYVARKACGCIYAAISLDCPPGDIADELYEWTNDGATIDRVTDEVVRSDFMGWNCPHSKAEAELKQGKLFS